MCADYELEPADLDRAALGGDDDWDPSSLPSLAEITPGTLKAPPVCNLSAPIVVHPRKMLGKQVLQIGGEHPTIYPLAEDEPIAGPAATSGIVLPRRARCRGARSEHNQREGQNRGHHPTRG